MNKDNKKTEEIFFKAHQKHQKNNFNEAEKLYKNILTKNPNHFKSAFFLALLLAQNKNFIESKKFFLRAIQINPNNADVCSNLANIHKELGEPEKAIDLYNKAIEINPNHADACYNIGNILKDLGEYEKAINFYNKVIKIQPNYAKAHNNLGLIFYEMKDYKKAISCYEKTISINPESANAYFNLANILKELGEHTKAINYYQTAIKKKPTYKYAYYNLGILFKKLERHKEAIESFKKANIDRSRVELLEYAYFLNGLKQYHKLLDKFVKEDPQNLRIAALASFVSKKEKIINSYPFCKDPLNFIYIKNTKNELINSQKFSTSLLTILRELRTIWEPSTTTTKKGYQTIGNLFEKKAKEIQILSDLIEKHVTIYREIHKNKDDFIITKWPRKRQLWGWHVRLMKQGHQRSHIHPAGWLSGVFYLKLPKFLNKYEGGIKFMLSGDDENPNSKNLPSLQHLPKTFDIALFPSSLFHRTIPFNSNEERHSVAFDINPI